MPRCEPRISAHAFPTRWRLKKKMTWSRYLFLFYFLKGKQNKKENPKCDSLFGKVRSTKNRIGFGIQVTYQEGTVETVAPI